VLLGVGWNFLSHRRHRAADGDLPPGGKAKAQGANDLFISSPWRRPVLLGHDPGDERLADANYAAIPFVLAMGVAVLWLKTKRRGTTVAA
jgi:hypothetical protein